MNVEYFVIAWLFGMVLPDGRTVKYHDTFSNRFKTEVECQDYAKTLPNKFPRENQIDVQGYEVRYADFHCLGIKRPEGAQDAYAVQKPIITPPLPPRRPAGL